MFLVNSRLGCFAAAGFRRRPFSRSYGAHLPSSLTRVLSNALVSSTHLPVSVCSTVGNAVDALGIFSAPVNLSSFAHKGRTSPASAFLPLFQETQPKPSPELPTVRDQVFESVLPLPASRVRNFDRISIGYAFWPRLRDRLTSV